MCIWLFVITENQIVVGNYANVWQSLKLFKINTIITRYCSCCCFKWILTDRDQVRKDGRRSMWSSFHLIFIVSPAENELSVRTFFAIFCPYWNGKSSCSLSLPHLRLPSKRNFIQTFDFTCRYMAST